MSAARAYAYNFYEEDEPVSDPIVLDDFIQANATEEIQSDNGLQNWRNHTAKVYGQVTSEQWSSSFEYDIEQTFDHYLTELTVPPVRFSQTLQPSQIQTFFTPKTISSMVGVLSIVLLLIMINPLSWLGQNTNKTVPIFVGSNESAMQTAQIKAFNTTEVQVALNRVGSSVIGEPSISPENIDRVLSKYNSPAVGLGKSLYSLGIKYGIDPAYALAFFIKESSAGTAGIATVTKSIGNIRVTPGYQNYQGFRKYTSWEEGAEDWFKLIKNLYVSKWGLNTVEAIIPVYAPAADNNNPTAYISSVNRLVTNWRNNQF